MVLRSLLERPFWRDPRGVIRPASRETLSENLQQERPFWRDPRGGIRPASRETLSENLQQERPFWKDPRGGIRPASSRGVHPTSMKSAFSRMGPALAFVALLALMRRSVAVAQPRGRILGGAETKLPLRPPYMASIQVNETHECGGLLMAQQWVLSAAHCLPESNSSRLRVLLGAHSLTEPEPSKQYFQIRKLVAHPNYTTANNHNDILLLQLNETVILGPEVQVFPIEREDVDVEAGTECRVAGWGMISLTGKRPDKMHQVEVPIISRETCNRRDQYDNEITRNMLCAGGRRKDSCEGDSGGPLVCAGKAVGIVSWGNRKCGNIKKPGIYTRISAFIAWIDFVLEDSRREEELERARASEAEGPVAEVPVPA